MAEEGGRPAVSEPYPPKGTPSPPPPLPLPLPLVSCDSTSPAECPPPSSAPDVHSQGAAAAAAERLRPLLPDPPHRHPPQPAQRPRSIAEAYPRPSPMRASATSRHTDDTHLLQPAFLPVQRSHSDSAPLFTLQGSVPAPPPQPRPHGGPCGTRPGLGEHRGAALPAPTQQRWHQEAAPCHGSYAHTDTFAARCHQGTASDPPTTALDLMGSVSETGLMSSVSETGLMSSVSEAGLMSSVSETGLDAKRMLHCCDHHDCSWVSSLPPGFGPWSLQQKKQQQQHQQQQQQQQHQRFGLSEVCLMGGPGPRGVLLTTTRDVSTMTAHRRMVDSGVQTEHSPPPHVFPQVCLVEENGNATDGNHNKTAGKGINGQKTPVKEVKWDAEGMTWEVYGAAVDPEELGLAIQKHLELQIKETAGRAAKLCRQDTSTSRQNVPPADSRRRKRSRMMIGSIRSPACCARSSTAVD